MQFAITKNNKIIECDYEILEYIRENPSGITITGTSKEMAFLKNIISKYVSILEINNKRLYLAFLHCL